MANAVLKFALPVIFAVKPSALYAMIRNRMAEIIPLNKQLGIELVSVDDGVAEARLAFHNEITNHIGSVHATAIFGLAEAASGCAMAGAFAPVAASIRPLAVEARIEFTKIARTDIVAHAKTSVQSNELRETLRRDGKVVFDVDVSVRNTTDEEISRVTFSWHVSNKQ